MLVAKPPGNYRFLATSGESPFCDAVIADPGFEVMRATLASPVPYKRGFQLIEQHLKTLGRPRQALCALELRCSEPYTPEGFREFNAEYAEILTDWGLYEGARGTGSTARTNVAPVKNPPIEQVLFAFCYTVPTTSNRPTFVVSGAVGGRIPESPDANRQRVANIVKTLTDRMDQMNVSWDLTTEIFLYAPEAIEAALRSELFPQVENAVLKGVRWFPSFAPVIGGVVELGTHGIRQELHLEIPSA